MRDFEKKMKDFDQITTLCILIIKARNTFVQKSKTVGNDGLTHDTKIGRFDIDWICHASDLSILVYNLPSEKG